MALKNSQLVLNKRMDSLATRARFARKRLKLSQAQVASKSGLNQSDVSKIERGEILKTTGLFGLSKALRVRIEWLHTGNGPMELEPKIPATDTAPQAVNHSPLALDLAGMLDEIQDERAYRRAYAQCVLILTGNQIYTPPASQPTPEPEPEKQKRPEQTRVLPPPRRN